MELTTEQKADMKKLAISISADNICGILDDSGVQKRTATEIINDAEKIYKWLTTDNNP